MKRIQKTTIIRLVSSFIALSGIVLLLIDGVVKPFLDDYSEVKIIIILISVLSAYHTFLTFSIKSIIQEELESTNASIKNVDSKVGLLKESIPYNTLDEIEYRHGHNTKSENCEMWIIANMLQEAKNDDSMLLTIYENISQEKQWGASAVLR